MTDTTLITGGASGIGLAAAERLLSQGARVAIVDREITALSSAAEALHAFKDQVRFDVLDVTDEDATGRIVAKIEDWGPISGLVNSAGIAQDVPFFETTIAQFRKIYDVNVVGTFLVAKACALRMRERQRGSIVNIASVSGIRGNLGRSAYGASKGAVIVLTQVMAMELAQHGIRVNAVAPGPVETPMVTALHTSGTRQGWTDRVALRRYASPEEIAGTIVHLLDEKSASYVTGQILAVDGGFTAGGLM